jgi:hypothetical protein
MEIQVDVPDNQSGAWSVQTFTISEEAARFENMRMSFTPGMASRSLEPGTYKRLCRNGHVVMSNTRSEINDHRHFIRLAKGSILINGLGLGVCLKAILEKPEVESVTVIEKSEDVINLVAPTFIDDKRVTIIHADALEWKPPKSVRYDCVWHDIWDNICLDNLLTMGTLHRKYGRRCEWQDSWCRDWLKYEQRRERNSIW